MNRTHASILSGLVAGLLYGASAFAQSADVTARLRHGIELRRQGHDEEARGEFQQAYDAGHAPVAAAQLGFAEQALGQWVAAEAHVREAMGAADDAWVQRNRATLEGAYATIAQHVGRLEVRGGPAGAEVFVEGQHIATLPMHEAMPVLAGSAQLEVRAEGYEPVVRTVTIAPGGLARETVALRRSAATGATGALAPVADSSGPTVPVDARTAPPPRAGLIGGLVLGGVGLATLGVGAVLVGTQLGPSFACQGCADPTLYASAQSAGTLVIVGDGLMIGGGVVATVGVLWMVLDRGGLHSTRTSATALTVVPGPRGIRLEGRF